MLVKMLVTGKMLIYQSFNHGWRGVRIPPSPPKQKPLMILVFLGISRAFCCYSGIYTGKIFHVQEAEKQVLEHIFRQKWQVKIARKVERIFFWHGIMLPVRS